MIWKISGNSTALSPTAEKIAFKVANHITIHSFCVFFFLNFQTVTLIYTTCIICVQYILHFCMTLCYVIAIWVLRIRNLEYFSQSLCSRYAHGHIHTHTQIPQPASRLILLGCTSYTCHVRLHASPHMSSDSLKIHPYKTKNKCTNIY